MKNFIKRNIFLTVLLIFMGLSVSAAANAAEYEVFSDYYETVLPSQQTAYDADMFSSHSSVPPIQRGVVDDEEEDDINVGGGKDPGCASNDGSCPVGNGVYVLLSLLCAYGGLLFYRSKKTVTA